MKKGARVCAALAFNSPYIDINYLPIIALSLRHAKWTSLVRMELRTLGQDPRARTTLDSRGGLFPHAIRRHGLPVH